MLLEMRKLVVEASNNETCLDVVEKNDLNNLTECSQLPHYSPTSGQLARLVEMRDKVTRNKTEVPENPEKHSFSRKKGDKNKEKSEE